MAENVLLMQDGSNTIREIANEFFLLLQDATPIVDQIAIQLPKTLVDEETTFTATAHFRDQDSKKGATPTTVHYRVDCLTTKTTLQTWTTATTGTQSAITITSAMNKIQSDSNRRETKQLTVQADRGLSTQITRKITWKVINQFGIGGNV